MRTQIAIVGAGPAGLTLFLLLAREGIDSVVLESRTREHVETRVRAGLLEDNTVELMNDLGVGERLAREGLEHHGIYVRRRGRTAAGRARASIPTRENALPRVWRAQDFSNYMTQLLHDLGGGAENYVGLPAEADF